MLRPRSKAIEHDPDVSPVGDRRFDESFATSVRGVEAARLLDAEIRERLLELRALGLQVRANDSVLRAWFGFNRNDPEAVPRVLRELAHTAALVSERARVLRSE